MKILIKSQVAILASLLAAFALTLTACGGGSSSSSAGGSGSLNAATVSGSVTGNGLSILESRDSSGLLIAVGDILIPLASADDPAVVTIDCENADPVSGPVVNGQFSVEVTDVPPGGDTCDVLVDGLGAGTRIKVEPNHTTTVQVVVDNGSAHVVMAGDPVRNPGSSVNALVTGDATSSDDDIASADDISSDDGESDATSDEDSADNESSDASSSSSST